MTDFKSKFQLAKPIANGLVLLAFLTVLSPIGLIIAAAWLIDRWESQEDKQSAADSSSLSQSELQRPSGRIASQRIALLGHRA